MPTLSVTLYVNAPSSPRSTAVPFTVSGSAGSEVPENVNSGAVTFKVSFSGEDITRRMPLSTGACGSELASADETGGLSSRAFAAREPVFRIITTATVAAITAPKAAPEIISAFRKVAFILFLALKKYCFL